MEQWHEGGMIRLWAWKEGFPFIPTDMKHQQKIFSDLLLHGAEDEVAWISRRTVHTTL